MSKHGWGYPGAPNSGSAPRLRTFGRETTNFRPPARAGSRPQSGEEGAELLNFRDAAAGRVRLDSETHPPLASEGESDEEKELLALKNTVPTGRRRGVTPSTIVESILLIARDPLSARKLAVLAELADPTEARTIARQLNEEYDRLGYSFRIEEVAGGLQLLTRPQFARWIRRLELVPGEVLLSQGMLEVLSIIAYKQPIQRVEIEAIRGVSCDEVLRQLMQRDLVRIAGRLEDLGRPYLYGTTRTFLQLFGLQSLESLPRAQKIREAEAEIASRLAVQTSTAQDMAPAAESDGSQ